jgi:diaminohydroxyphosphoribosylaminopyrimidine deaminase/5-amino-6-(5-phosphoribosylamino)uracil reductase
MWSASDFQHMSRAIHLARRGLYSTDPNPRVGCVIVKDDVVLSEGWHQKAGQGHAEIEALNNAKQNNTTDNVSGATCYITLEPCAHQGRTPPCTESLIEAGIKKVIAASIDPNPRVAGKGLQQLKEAGIESVSGLMEAQAVELNPGFEMRMKQGRPFVRCKLAMSLDGKTALHNGESKWISSPESRMDVQKLRARSSAIMTGIGTVIADDPSMNVRLSESSEWARHGRQPLRVILDSDLEISSEAKILNISGDVIIFHQSDNKDRVEKLENKGAELVTVEEARGSAFLKQVLNYLATEKEINEILLETGSTLAGEMLQAGFIDELIIYIAPALLGQDAKSLFQLPMIEDMTDRISLDISDVRSIGKDIRIKATVNR